MEPIELDADGLLLRAWRPEDAADVHRACQDPLVQRWTRVPAPYTREHADAFCGPYTVRSWQEETAAPLGVFDATTHEMLGSCGLVELDRAERTGAVGMWLAPWARGRGIGERAVRAVAYWSFDVLGLQRLDWVALLGNHRSRLVAERVGFLFEGIRRRTFHDRSGALADGWEGVLLPGQIRRAPTWWLAAGGPAARRAATFSRPHPVLPAGPVTLRALDERDLAGMVAASSDPEAVRWTTVPTPYGEGDARWFFLERGHTGWAAGTMATFALADAEDRFAGVADLRIDPADPVIAELGFLLGPHARGRGYATAAVRALCAWGFEALALQRIVWRAHVGNEASRRVAERAGFVMEGTLRQGLAQRGERHDGWIASLLPGDL